MVLTMPAFAPPSAASPPGKLPDLQQLEDALLTEREVPKGYVFFNRITSAPIGETIAFIPCESPLEVVFPLGPFTSVTFQKGKEGPVVTEWISAVGAVPAGERVKRTQAFLDDCPSEVDDDVTTTWSRWPSPEVGDASIGILVTTTSKEGGDPPVKTAMVVVARGDIVATFTLTATDSAESASFAEIIKAGVDKLKKIK